MIKKFISILLSLIICLSLCACGNDNETEAETKKPSDKAIVVNNDGSEVEISAKELIEEFDANEARFAKYYSGATISFTGTVKRIRIETDVYNGDGWYTKQNMIEFEEGWILIIGAKNENFDLAEYYPGQKLSVSTGIISPTPSQMPLFGYERAVWLVGNDKLHFTQVNDQITTIRIV